MKKLFYLIGLAALLVSLTIGCQNPVETSDLAVASKGLSNSAVFVPEKGDLIAGKHFKAGTVSTSNDEEYLYVTYSFIDSWVMTESHLAVALTLDGIPQTESGNPIPGQFNHKMEYDPPTTEYCYTIPLGDYGFTEGDVVYLAAHAEVQKVDETGSVVEAEGAWAAGEEDQELKGSNWATYMTVEVIQDTFFNSEIRLTSDSNGSHKPSLVWTGTEYGIAWMDEPWNENDPFKMYFARMDTTGQTIGDQHTIQTSHFWNAGNVPSLVWTGTEYSIAWFDSRNNQTDIYFTRIDETGKKVGDDINISNVQYLSQNPSLIWNGGGYGIAWCDVRNALWHLQLYFARLDFLGNKIGDEVRISESDAYFPSLVWTGTEYGVAWHSNQSASSFPAHRIYFARIDSFGNRIGNEVRITDSKSCFAKLVWTGQEYGLAWTDERDYSSPTGSESEIYFVRIDTGGNKIGDDTRITYSAYVSSWLSLIWTGSEYGVAWRDNRDGNDEIYFARIDVNGNKIGDDIRVTNAPNHSYWPSLVWTGTKYAVAWEDDRSGDYDIYFAQ